MTFFKRGEPTEFTRAETTDLDKSIESTVETEIREFVRRDVASRSPETENELITNNISTLLQRVAGSSVAEIDRLTSELHTLRELLQSERSRVQREITQYAHLNQSAMQSTKIISESVANCKKEDAQATSVS
jgi:cell division septum initiation protein DivIVA